MESKLERWFLLAWLLVSVWILASAFLVQGEYGDGYQTIVNARYFFGDSQNYYVQRGPLAAVALWPVETIVSAFALDPLDVRPFHVLSALLHSAYLLGCWVLLRYAPGNTAARLLAFGSAILSVVFYAYAPYLSHDLLPGLFFLLLIFLCHRWLEHQSKTDSLYLVLLGAAVTLIKQTYAIFWFALIFYALVAFMLKWDSGRVTARKLIVLSLLAAVSAAISWLGYGLFIAAELPDVSLLARPLSLMAAVSSQYSEGLSALFASDLYLRNLHNYGIAAMLLVIPGLVMAFRGTDARMRLIAVCWLLAAVIMQLVSFREVRYLAFLAPLTAMLMAPVARSLLAHRVYAVAIIAIVLVDQMRGLTVAAEQITSVARANATEFINAPKSSGTVFASSRLNFVYDSASPLLRDRYHGIFHLTPDLLRGLNEGSVNVVMIEDVRRLGLIGIQPGDRVYYSNYAIVRRPPWSEDNQPTDIEKFVQVAGDAATLRLALINDNYEREDNDGSYILFIPANNVGQAMPVISRGSLPAETAAALFGDILDQNRLDVTGVIVKAMCQADSCTSR